MWHEGLKMRFSNAGDPPQGDQVPHLEKGVNDDQAPVNPSALTDENIRTTLLQISQNINTQAQVATYQAQGMTDHANRKVVPRLVYKLLIWLPV